MQQRTFSAEHRRRAVELYDRARREGLDRKAAERACGHAGGVIASWRAMLDNAPASTAKQRTCICCRRPFRSAGPGNRICKTCKRSQESGLPSGWDEALGDGMA